MTAPRNEGEGNHTAAKQYNDAQKGFAESGTVEQAAKDAAQAVDGPEGSGLRQAEEEGKRRSHGEDPQLKKWLLLSGCLPEGLAPDGCASLERDRVAAATAVTGR